MNAREAIKEQYPSGELRDRYTKALSAFRIPYWDWAAVPPSGEGTFPKSVQQPEIGITLVNGTTKIPNPMYAYNFHPIPNWEHDIDWTEWSSTKRAPPSRNLNATSRNEVLARNLDRNRNNIQARIYNMLTTEHNYLRMSNDLSKGDSLENIHGNIHNTVGGSGAGRGHMWYPKFSAFDPVFMMHHA